MLLSGSFFSLPFGQGTGPERARRTLASEVVVWVGDLAPGLRGVLSPVWGEPGPDREHDRTLNAGLHVRTEDLAFYRLLLFNTSEETRSVRLENGALEISRAGDGAPVGLRSLAALLREGGAFASPALAIVLEGQGALEEELVLPPGMMADLLVAFDGHVALEEAASVRGGDGVAFARRRIERGELEALLQAPDSARIRDL